MFRRQVNNVPAHMVSDRTDTQKSKLVKSKQKICFRQFTHQEPWPLTHISTGVVYASPGVVKIPP
jgi:hypothetical protein